MPVRGFDHIAITVTDVERSVAFYVEVLSAEVQRLEEFRSGTANNVTLVFGANRMNIHPSPPRSPQHLVARRPTPGAADLCFRWLGPIEAAIEMVARHGLELIEGPVPRPAADGSVAVSIYTRDLDGNLLEFLTTD